VLRTQELDPGLQGTFLMYTIKVTLNEYAMFSAKTNQTDMSVILPYSKNWLQSINCNDPLVNTVLFT